jgi:hypothetical protein
MDFILVFSYHPHFFSLILLIALSSGFPSPMLCLELSKGKRKRRERKRERGGQVYKGSEDSVEEFGFCLQCNGKEQEKFNQETDMIHLMF